MLIATSLMLFVEWKFQEHFYEWTNTIKKLSILIHEKKNECMKIVVRALILILFHQHKRSVISRFVAARVISISISNK